MAEHMTAAAARPLVYGFGESQDVPKDDRNVRGCGDGERVPVTILTGFLGSGKTTLLNRVLTAQHGKRIAVIQNEFGADLGLGSTVSAEGAGGEVFEECYEMNNGCICCSVRDELVNTLERIMTKRHKFDYVLVETTGMANPGPLASIFWLDDELGSDLFLDAIITLVDAKHVLQHLDDPSPSGGSFEAAQQIAFADRILLNKIDLVSEEHLAAVEARIRLINAMAPIVRTCKSDVDLDTILDVRAFDQARAQELEMSLNMFEEGGEGARARVCQRVGEDSGVLSQPNSSPLQTRRAKEGGQRKGAHDSQIGTVSIYEEGPLDDRKLNLWLGELLWESDAGKDIFRLKGILSVAGQEHRMVLQGVHTLFEITPSTPWPVGAACRRYSKLVFIGRHLNRPELQAGLTSCRAD